MPLISGYVCGITYHRYDPAAQVDWNFLYYPHVIFALARTWRRILKEITIIADVIRTTRTTSLSELTARNVCFSRSYRVRAPAVIIALRFRGSCHPRSGPATNAHPHVVCIRRKVKLAVKSRIVSEPGARRCPSLNLQWLSRDTRAYRSQRVAIVLTASDNRDLGMRAQLNNGALWEPKSTTMDGGRGTAVRAPIDILRCRRHRLSLDLRLACKRNARTGSRLNLSSKRDLARRLKSTRAAILLRREYFEW